MDKLTDITLLMGFVLCS